MLKPVLILIWVVMPSLTLFLKGSLDRGHIDNLYQDVKKTQLWESEAGFISQSYSLKGLQSWVNCFFFYFRFSKRRLSIHAYLSQNIILITKWDNIHTSSWLSVCTRYFSVLDFLISPCSAILFMSH